MKKLLLFLLATCYLSINSFASLPITILKENKGPNGYYLVDEDHDSDGSSLLCQNPGYDDCIFVITPSVVGPSATAYNVYFLSTLAENEINNGNLSGTILHNGEITITWSGTSLDYKITIISE